MEFVTSLWCTVISPIWISAWNLYLILEYFQYDYDIIVKISKFHRAPITHVATLDLTKSRWVYLDCFIQFLEGFFDVLFILNNLDLDIISYSNGLSLDTSVNTSKPMRVMNWLFIYHRLTIKNHEEKSTTNLREFSLLLVYLQYKDWYMVYKYWLGVV